MKFSFHYGYLKNNHHGTQKKGEPWNRQTVRGWKVKIVTLETIVRVATAIGNAPHSDANVWLVQSFIGRRLWIYRPSGGCWNFDVGVDMTVEKKNERET